MRQMGYMMAIGISLHDLPEELPSPEPMLSGRTRAADSPIYRFA